MGKLSAAIIIIMKLITGPLPEEGETEAIMLGPAGIYAHAVSTEAIRRDNGRYILYIIILNQSNPRVEN